jgi:lysophospholipase L1-like esterase
MIYRKLLAAAIILAAALAPAPGAAAATTGTQVADKSATGPVTVIPKFRKDKPRFAQRHQENLERIKQAPIDLLFVGDSITDQWSTKGSDVWKTHFTRWNPANFGVGGDRTENVIWRITNGELDGFSPKVMVLMIGTNNTHSNSAEDIVAGIRKIIDITRQKSPEAKVLLLAVFPREPRMRDGELYKMPSEKVREINRMLPALADGNKVRFLDIGHNFIVDGRIPKDIMPDGLHLTQKGYELWAKAITPVLEEMMQ